jgi:MYXO-CTERM domain-containing protein
MQAGKSMATMIVRNNDSMISMPAVVLEGNGKDRNVDVTPGAVDVGDTFAGVPTRLSINRPLDMLTVVNNELPDGTRNDFRIAAIMVDGVDAEAFEVVGLDGESIADRMLPAGQNVAIDVIFKPDRVGDFEASLVLYLDDDPISMTPVPVRGRALFVDAHGSGGFGCSTGHGSRGMMLLVIGALALVLRRRRR